MATPRKYPDELRERALRLYRQRPSRGLLLVIGQAAGRIEVPAEYTLIRSGGRGLSTEANGPRVFSASPERWTNQISFSCR